MGAGNDLPLYVREAIATFDEIMALNQKGALEKLNRVNKGELFVLHHLASRQDQVLPTELGAALKSSNARISALLGVLEKKGLVERDIDTSDRRNVLVSITPLGRERIATEMGHMRTCLAKVFTAMGAEDTLLFLRLAKRFSELVYEHAPTHLGDSS